MSLCTDGTAQTDVEEQVTLNSLVFFTGAAREPPTGFTVQPKLVFVGEHLATAATLGLGCQSTTRHIMNNSRVTLFYH